MSQTHYSKDGFCGTYWHPPEMCCGHCRYDWYWPDKVTEDDPNPYYCGLNKANEHLKELEGEE